MFTVAEIILFSLLGLLIAWVTLVMLKQTRRK